MTLNWDIGMSQTLVLNASYEPLNITTWRRAIILMLKGTSLASVITIMDLMGEARKVNVLTFKPFEAFITAGIIYLFITFIIHNIIKYLEKKYGFQT